MGAHVLLNLSNGLGKRDEMRGLPRISSLLQNELIKFNNTAPSGQSVQRLCYSHF